MHFHPQRLGFVRKKLKIGEAPRAPAGASRAPAEMPSRQPPAAEMRVCRKLSAQSQPRKISASNRGNASKLCAAERGPSPRRWRMLPAFSCRRRPGSAYVLNTPSFPWTVQLATWPQTGGKSGSPAQCGASFSLRWPARGLGPTTREAAAREMSECTPQADWRCVVAPRQGITGASDVPEVGDEVLDVALSLAPREQAQHACSPVRQTPGRPLDRLRGSARRGTTERVRHKM